MAADPAKKKCTATGCSTRDIVVTTEAETCVVCGKPLATHVPSLADLFGGGDLDQSVLDGLFGRPK